MDISQNSIRSGIKLSLIGCTLLLAGLFNTSQAQNTCTNKLKEAESNYENGLIEEIPEMLKPCMKNGFTKEEKIRGYKLIIKSHLFNQDMSNAAQAMLDFLRDYPEYLPETTTDGLDFIKLHNRFETLPYLTMSVFAGANTSSVSVIQPYTLDDNEQQSYTYGTPGFQLGLQFSRPFYQYFDISLGVELQRHTFQYTGKSFGFSKLTLQERQTKLTIPALGTFIYPIKKWHPFIALGFNISYLMSDQATPTRIYTDNSNDDITGTDIDMLIHRQKIIPNLVAELGVRYKIPEGYFFFKTAYQLGLMNQTNTNARYDNPELMYIYYYLDDDFKINNLSFSIGYTRMLYKPKPKE